MVHRGATVLLGKKMQTQRKSSCNATVSTERTEDKKLKRGSVVKSQQSHRLNAKPKKQLREEKNRRCLENLTQQSYDFEVTSPVSTLSLSKSRLGLRSNSLENIKTVMDVEKSLKSDRNRKVRRKCEDSAKATRRFKSFDELEKNSGMQKSFFPPCKLICSLPLERLSGILKNILPNTATLCSNISNSYTDEKTDETNALSSKDNSSLNTASTSSIFISQQSTKSLCLYCDKKFSSQKLRIKHTERVHTAMGGRRLSSRHSLACASLLAYPGCSFCCNGATGASGKLTTTAIASEDLNALFRHLIDSHSEKYFACKLCQIRYSTSVLLGEHNEQQHKKITGSTAKATVKKSKKCSVITPTSEESELPLIQEKDLICFTDRLGRFCTIQNDDDDELSLPESTPTKTRRQLRQAMLNRPPALTRAGQNVLRTDAAILSRLGVAQNRLPRGRKGVRNRRIVNLELSKLDLTQPSLIVTKQRSKIGRVMTSVVLEMGEASGGLLTSGGTLAGARCTVNSRVDPVNSTFDEDFYETVSLNVKQNLSCHMDGKLEGDSSSPDSSTSATPIAAIRSTFIRSPSTNDNEIHKATALTALTAFPTLLTAEQYGSDLGSSSKIKKPITKNSWKWKWDCVKKYKYVNEGGKIVKKVKQPVAGLRDLSKLDMWTQLTMRTKHEIVRMQNYELAGRDEVLPIAEAAREEKRKQIAQLNTILDSRRLPQIVLEQSEQTVIKVEVLDDPNPLVCTSPSVGSSLQSFEDVSNQSYEDSLPRLLNLHRSDKSSQPASETIILSGEWARPRCYICFGCGAKFEKLKILEEHKLFRHPHIYSTHYEIVGRELIEGDLYKHFYIPSKALSRHREYRMLIKPKTEEAESGVVGEESMDSLTTISASTSASAITTLSSKTTETVSTFSSVLNCASIAETSTSSSKAAARKCTKCERECGGLLELYRHMLDCSGDYAWILAKKRKPRYYCGSSSRRRRHAAKHNTGFKQRKSLKSPSKIEELEDDDAVRSMKTKVETPRPPRPSDVESIRRMLENLPAKRACRQVIPNVTKPCIRIKKKILVNSGSNGNKKTKTSVVRVASTTVSAISQNIRRKRLMTMQIQKRHSRVLRNLRQRRNTEVNFKHNGVKNIENLTNVKKDITKHIPQEDVFEKVNIKEEVFDPRNEFNEKPAVQAKKNMVQKLGTKTKRFVQTIKQKLQKNNVRANETISKDVEEDEKSEKRIAETEPIRDIEIPSTAIVDQVKKTKSHPLKADFESRKSKILLKTLNFRKSYRKRAPVDKKHQEHLSENSTKIVTQDSKINEIIEKKETYSTENDLDLKKQLPEKSPNLKNVKKGSVKKILKKLTSQKDEADRKEEPRLNYETADTLEAKGGTESQKSETDTPVDSNGLDVGGPSTLPNVNLLPPPPQPSPQISPTTKRRNKKLNECIAMLTGKLQEKLGKPFFASNESLDHVLASKSTSTEDIGSPTTPSPSFSTSAAVLSTTPDSGRGTKPTKRKTFSRKIVKTAAIVAAENGNECFMENKLQKSSSNFLEHALHESTTTIQSSTDQQPADNIAKFFDSVQNETENAAEVPHWAPDPKLTTLSVVQKENSVSGSLADSSGFGTDIDDGLVIVDNFIPPIDRLITAEILPPACCSSIINIGPNVGFKQTSDRLSSNANKKQVTARKSTAKKKKFESEAIMPIMSTPVILNVPIPPVRETSKFKGGRISKTSVNKYNTTKAAKKVIVSTKSNQNIMATPVSPLIPAIEDTHGVLRPPTVPSPIKFSPSETNDISKKSFAPAKSEQIGFRNIADIPSSATTINSFTVNEPIPFIATELCRSSRSKTAARNFLPLLICDEPQDLRVAKPADQIVHDYDLPVDLSMKKRAPEESQNLVARVEPRVAIVEPVVHSSAFVNKPIAEQPLIVHRMQPELRTSTLKISEPDSARPMFPISKAAAKSFDDIPLIPLNPVLPVVTNPKKSLTSKHQEMKNISVVSDALMLHKFQSAGAQKFKEHVLEDSNDAIRSTKTTEREFKSSMCSPVATEQNLINKNTIPKKSDTIYKTEGQKCDATVEPIQNKMLASNVNANHSIADILEIPQTLRKDEITTGIENSNQSKEVFSSVKPTKPEAKIEPVVLIAKMPEASQTKKAKGRPRKVNANPTDGNNESSEHSQTIRYESASARDTSISTSEPPGKVKSYTRIPNKDTMHGNIQEANENVVKYRKTKTSYLRDSGTADIDISMYSCVDQRTTEEMFLLSFAIEPQSFFPDSTCSSNKISSPKTSQQSSPLLTARRRSNRNKPLKISPGENKVQEIEDIVASFLSEDEEGEKESAVNVLSSSSDVGQTVLNESDYLLNKTDTLDDVDAGSSKTNKLESNAELLLTVNKPSSQSSEESFRIVKPLRKRGRPKGSTKAGNIEPIMTCKSSDSVILHLKEATDPEFSENYKPKPKRGRPRRKSVFDTDPNMQTEERHFQLPEKPATPSKHQPNCSSPVSKQKTSLELPTLTEKRLLPIDIAEKKTVKRRRKNELAAIVADQLMESFKEVDQSRIDDLKLLENLAYEKSEDLFLTGMRLTPTTKRKIVLGAEKCEASELNAAHSSRDTQKDMKEIQKQKRKQERRSKSQPNISQAVETNAVAVVEKEGDSGLTSNIKHDSEEKQRPELNQISQSHENLFRSLPTGKEPLKLNVDPRAQKQNFRIVSNFNTTSFDAFSTFKSSFDNFRSMTDFSFMGSRKELLRKNNFTPGSAETSNSVDSQALRSNDTSLQIETNSVDRLRIHKKSKKPKAKSTVLPTDPKKDGNKQVDTSENINELRNGLESFTFGKNTMESFSSLKRLANRGFGFFSSMNKTFGSVPSKTKQVAVSKRDVSTSSNVFSSIVKPRQIIDLSKDSQSILLKKQSPFLRPSVLATASATPETALAPNAKRTAVSSRDPRLNKAKVFRKEADEDAEAGGTAFESRRRLGSLRQRRKSLYDVPSSSNTTFVEEKLRRGRSSSRITVAEEKTPNLLISIAPESDSDEEDTCLAAIAESVKERIGTTADEDFNDAQDGFNIVPDPSILMAGSQPARPKSAMGTSYDDDEDDNTNTELIDMDLEDDISVYTSFSQDVRGRGRRRRRRRALFVSRRTKKTVFDPNAPLERFDCALCSKTFRKALALSKHKMTLGHISKLSEQEYFLSLSKKQICVTPPTPMGTDSASPVFKSSSPGVIIKQNLPTPTPAVLRPQNNFLHPNSDVFAESSRSDHENSVKGNVSSIVEEIPVVTSVPASASSKSNKPISPPHHQHNIQQQQREFQPPVINLSQQSGIGPISSPEQVDRNYDNNPNPTSRIALSQEERLFYECCNMLKGSETPMVEGSYSALPNSCVNFDVPNKPAAPRFTDRSSYLGSEASVNFDHSTAINIKCPIAAHSRLTTKRGYSKVDANHFSDISSDSNPAFPRVKPHLNLQTQSTHGAGDRLVIPSAMPQSQEELIGTQHHRSSVAFHHQNYQPGSGAYFGSADGTYTSNLVPLTTRTFEERSIRIQKFSLHDGGANLTVEPERLPVGCIQSQAFTSPLHSTSSQESSITTTTCRMRTKAAMKGYDNFKVSIPTTGLDMQQALECSPQVGCKLTALAEIALGSETPPNTSQNDTPNSLCYSSHEFPQENDINNIGLHDDMPKSIEASTRLQHEKQRTEADNNQLMKSYQELAIKNIAVTDRDFREPAQVAPESNKAVPERRGRGRPPKHQHVFANKQKKPKDIYDFNDSEEQSSTSKIKVIGIAKPVKETAEEHIVIPERPFKDIGLEHPSPIKFHKPFNPSIENLVVSQNDESALSSTSYSDRDDFNYNSVTENEDDEDGMLIRKGKYCVDEGSDSDSSQSSARTAKTIEAKNRIMGKIFKKNSTTSAPTNRNSVENKKEETTTPNTLDSKKIIPPQELNRLFDNLRKEDEKNQIKIAKTRQSSEDKPSISTGKPVRKKTELSKSTISKKQIKNLTGKSKKAAAEQKKLIQQQPQTKRMSRRKSIHHSRELEKLQLELGMSQEEIVELIGDGQRKSQRRCASNQQRKFVEIWSSDEYEEFLSTKDIIALIAEKEKQFERRRKNKSGERKEILAENENKEPAFLCGEKSSPNMHKTPATSTRTLKSSTKKPERIVDGLLQKFNSGEKRGTTSKVQPSMHQAEAVHQNLFTNLSPSSYTTKSTTEKLLDIPKFGGSSTSNSSTSAAEAITLNSNKKPTLSVKPRLKTHVSADSESDFESEYKMRGTIVKKAKQIKKRRKTVCYLPDADDFSPLATRISTSLAKKCKSSVIRSSSDPKTKPKLSDDSGKETTLAVKDSAAASEITRNKTHNASPLKTYPSEGDDRPLTRRKRVTSDMLYYWSSSSSDEEFGRIEPREDDDDDDLSQNGEPYQQHGWIVGDSHKKLVTLLAIAKGNKKVEDCVVKQTRKKT